MKFLRLHQVLDLVGMGRSAWYQRVLDGRAPKPLKVGSKIAVWPEDVVSKWQADILANGERIGTYSGRDGAS